MTSSITRLSQKEMNALTRTDLATFLEQSFGVLKPGMPFVPGWHIELICDRLMKCLNGQIKRLIINLPPRHMKSIAVNVAFSAFALGQNPGLEIISASYSQELANKHAEDTLAIMQSPFYRAAFGNILARENLQASNILTIKRGGRRATSTGGSITGFGCNILILDDLVKPQEARSDTMRQNANSWYTTSAYSRLNSKEHDVVIVIMQRLHESDLTGFLLEQEGWEHLVLPAIAEEDERWEYRTAFSTDLVIATRHAGEALHPARESLKVLEDTRMQMPPYDFAAQYQQRPAPVEGNILKRDYIHYYKTPPAIFDQIIQSWDTASKIGKNNDFTVCTTWGVSGKKLYLLDVFRKKLEFPALRRAIASQASLYQSPAILIEDAGSGIPLIQACRADYLAVKGIKPLGDKETRLLGQTGHFDSGIVLFPEAAPWLEALEHELLTFPGAKHDDQVDSVSQAITFFASSLKRNQIRIGAHYSSASDSYNRP